MLCSITTSDPFVARYEDGITVAANSSAMLWVELTPTQSGQIEGTLSFEWNDPEAGEAGATVEIPLTAVVLEDTGLDD